jgi:hypothetical protein
MSIKNGVAIGAAALIAALSTYLNGQQATVPEVLAQAGASVTREVGIGSGPAPSVTGILRDADAIVRGFVGESRTYLSDDKREVYTDYRTISLRSCTMRNSSSRLPLRPREYKGSW